MENRYFVILLAPFINSQLAPCNSHLFSRRTNLFSRKIHLFSRKTLSRKTHLFSRKTHSIIYAYSRTNLFSTNLFNMYLGSSRTKRSTRRSNHTAWGLWRKITSKIWWSVCQNFWYQSAKHYAPNIHRFQCYADGQDLSYVLIQFMMQRPHKQC